MRRLGWGLIAAPFLLGLIVLLGLIAARGTDAPSANAATRAPHRGSTKVSLYGDSLAFQARPAFVAAMTRRDSVHPVVSTRPGAALCDDRALILADLALRRPQVLVLEYSGNSYTGCMRDGSGALLEIGSRAWRNRYLADLGAILAVAKRTDTSVVWATAPPVSHAPDPKNYPRLLAAAVHRLAPSNDHLRVAPTGTSLTTDDRSFSRTLPCRADERAFCVRHRIPSRAADGLHFDCHGTVDAVGVCEGYSAGGRRFGEALATATLASVARRR